MMNSLLDLEKPYSDSQNRIKHILELSREGQSLYYAVKMARELHIAEDEPSLIWRIKRLIEIENELEALGKQHDVTA